MNSIVKLLPFLALLDIATPFFIPRNNDGSETPWYKTDKSTLRPETYKFIEANAKGLDIPGFTVAITSPKGDEIWSYGIRDKQGTPNDPKTFFGLASDSKLVGGVTLATIQEQGHTLSNGETFQLNSLVKDIDPSFKMYNETATNEATVNDFLAHFSGLPGHNWSLQPNDTNAAAFARLADLKPNLGFRELWQYSSLGYKVLGHIVDKVTGRTYNELVNEVVFKPLGLEATDVATVAKATGRLSQGFMRQGVNSTQCGFDLLALNQTLATNSTIQTDGYPAATLSSLLPESCIGRQESMEYWTDGSGEEWGAGGATIMTGEDILKWIKEVLNPQHISPSVIETCNKGLVNTSNVPTPGPPTQYAIGTIATDYKGYDTRLHDGALPGSNSFFQRVHNESIGVFVITNEDFYNQAFTPAVARTVLDDLLGLAPNDYFTSGLVGVNPILAYAQSIAAANSTEGQGSSDESATNSPSDPTAARRQVQEVNVDEWVGKSFSSPGYLPFTLEPLNLSDTQGTLDKYGFPSEFITTDVVSLTGIPTTGIPTTGPALIAQYGAAFCSHIVFTHFDGAYWNATGALVWDRVQTDSDSEGISPKIAKLTGAAPAVFGEDGIGLFGAILTVNAEAGFIDATTNNTAEVAPLFYALEEE